MSATPDRWEAEPPADGGTQPLPQQAEDKERQRSREKEEKERKKRRHSAPLMTERAAVT